MATGLHLTNRQTLDQPTQKLPLQCSQSLTTSLWSSTCLSRWLSPNSLRVDCDTVALITRSFMQLGYADGISHGSGWGFASGLDDRLEGTPLLPSTAIPGGSVTKTWTAVAVLQVGPEKSPRRHCHSPDFAGCCTRETSAQNPRAYTGGSCIESSKPNNYARAVAWG